MATPASSTIALPEIEVDHVRLIVAQTPGAFYLDIPLDVITRNCLLGRRYLLYLAVYITGVPDGSIFLEGEQGEQSLAETTGPVAAQEVYAYRVPDGVNPLGNSAIDLHVIEIKSSQATETAARDDFRERILIRESNCVFTGRNELLCQAQHLIPHATCDGWIQTIVENRPRDARERLQSLRSVDDVRNGLLVGADLHTGFNKRLLAVMKTPNRVLCTTDIPARAVRQLPANMEYPRNQSRFTAQWLTTTPDVISALPNNTDAAFNISPPHGTFRPADLFLHYTYCAAAVRRWGKANDILQGRDGIPQPDPSPGPLLGPERIKRTGEDLQASIEKRTRFNTTAGNEESGRGGLILQDDHGADAPDLGGVSAEELILMLWGSTPDAQARRKSKAAGFVSTIQHWRDEVLPDV